MENASRFRVPGLIVSGPGSAEEIPSVLAGLGVDRAIVVTDRNLRATIADPIIDALDDAGVLGGVYDEVVTEPTTAYVDGALAVLEETGAKALVAIGGGSAIDTAKAAAAAATADQPLRAYHGYNKFSNAPLPVVAVPTTAGTGSEATAVVVITDVEREIKMMFLADQLMAAAAVVDPRLTMTCPPSVTASSGVDALSHAIEAYVSRRAQPLTDALAVNATSVIGRNLRAAFDDGNDEDARSAVMAGALQAGIAFSNSSVALVHGMSRPLGALFHIPHGIANAMLLPAVMRFSLEAAIDRYGDLGVALGVATPDQPAADRAEAAVTEVEQLAADLGIPSLGGYGIDADRFEEVLDKMATDAIDSGSPANNPRVPSHAEIVEVYRLCY